MDLNNALRAVPLRKDIPEFSVGDTVKVNVKVVEGEKTRIQAFQGIVIKTRGSGTGATFTVRKISGGIGVERVFPVNSPSLDTLEVVRHGHVRRAKLYYLRGRKGRAVRVREKRKAVSVPQAEE